MTDLQKEAERLGITDIWDFIGRWHPNYNCNQVLWSDDIQCCLDGEAEGWKLQSVIDNFGPIPEHWLKAQEEIDRELLAVSVEAYKAAHK